MRIERSDSIVFRAYILTIDIIALRKQLVEKKEFVLSRQIVKSSSAVGAYVNEAVSSESKEETIHNMGSAAKKVRKSIWWLTLLNGSHHISKEEFEALNKSCGELLQMLESAIARTKER